MKFSKKLFFVSGIFTVSIISSQSFAQTSIASCADMADAEERLSCYDRAAESARNLPVVRLPRSARSETIRVDSSGNSGDNSNASISVPVQNGFGFSKTQDRERPFTVLTARHNDFTGWTVEFEGGGVWKQVGTDDYDIQVGERYTVRRNSFNSYMLSNSRNNKKIRIKRVE